MATTTTTTNKPLNPRAQDLSPKGYNRAALYSGKALDFDGVNDILTMPTALTSSLSTTSVTFVTNVKTDFATWSGTRDDVFTFAERGIILAFNDGNIYYYYRHQSSAWRTLQVPNADFKPQEWNQMVTTIDLNADTWKAYINGIEVATSNTYSDTAIAYDSNALTIGAQAGGRFFDGQIAGFKIFNTALTAAQVADLYLNPEKIVPDGVADSALKLWLPMMEGAGASAYDGSGNGNDGTINGATWTAGIGAPVAQTALVSWNKGSNLSTYSEQFDNAAWTKQDSTITANSTTSPDGNQNADELKVNTSTSFHQMTSAQVVSIGTTYAFSVYAKQGSGTKYLQFAGAGLQAASQAPIFDLQNGIAYTAATKTVCLSANIENVGNGWYRCSAIVSATGTAGFTICFTQTTNAFSGDSFAGNGTDSFYIWGAQVTQGTNLGPYIKTNATAQTSDVLVPEGLTAGASIFGTDIITPRNAFALNLDGASWAEVHDNASLDITSAITLEAWVYWNTSTDKGLMGKWDYNSSKASYLLYKQSASRFIMYVSSNGSTLASETNDTNISSGWNHLVGVYDGANLKCYLNGVVDGSSAYSSGLYSSDAVVEIGRYDQVSSTSYTNQIANPRIYNRALTAAEVLRNYNADRPKFGL